jgi:hypothetical protein
LESEPFTAEDGRWMKARGLDVEKAREELARFRKGPDFIFLERACGLGDGIIAVSEAERVRLALDYQAACDEGRAMQFVPASGAATRMFKSLSEILRRGDVPDYRALLSQGRRGDGNAREVLAFLQGLEGFPFAKDLERSLAQQGWDMETLIQSGQYRPVIESLTEEAGLGYAGKPKALIPFHAHPDGARMALEEHLEEAKTLVRDAQGICRLHFTVSSPHKAGFEHALEHALNKHATDGLRYRVTVSEQSRATDTLAADGDGNPFRDESGELVFRPGGHGALLGNLSHCGGDLVFIKNIDNVVPDSLRHGMVAWRRAMAGLLVRVQNGIFGHLKALRQGADPQALAAAARFAEERLGIQLPPHGKDFSGPLESERSRAYLIRILDRPVRVCAMVENRGEPGGGPFWVRHRDGSLRLQIVEPPQVDPDSESQKALVSAGGYFNPTDMVCGLLDAKGGPFELARFSDPETGFITSKSKDGRELQALELPGLWNGSMSDWNSVFMAAPAWIFNPVKSVVDLLRPEHTAASLRL